VDTVSAIWSNLISGGWKPDSQYRIGRGVVQNTGRTALTPVRITVVKSLRWLLIRFGIREELG
jgi:hypothetical protein